MIDYGNIIRTRRRELGISQADLAIKAVCHRTTIGKAERGESVSIDLFLDILRALGLRMEVIEDA